MNAVYCSGKGQLQLHGQIMSGTPNAVWHSRIELKTVSGVSVELLKAGISRKRQNELVGHQASREQKI